MKKLVFLFSLAVVIGIGGSSCNTCDDVTVLPDLLVKSLILPQTIAVGDTSFATAEVANEKDYSACDTKTAGFTSYSYEILKQKSHLNEWDTMYSEQKFQAEIEAGEYREYSLPIIIDDPPGTFQVCFITDFPDSIEERNETNNDSGWQKANRNGGISTISKWLKETNNHADITFEVIMLTDSTAAINILE